MTSRYLQESRLAQIPRLLLEASIDLTYRCNNNCRHCWLYVAPNDPLKNEELSIDEIKNIIDQSRQLGCRKWSISGGEPMLRPDFPEIFDYITSHSASYSLNTNGTLITPSIAKLLKRKGTKMVALYGATREVHDHITRNLGSYDATMRGFAYLKEEGAGFIVQLIPMKDNYHEFDQMVELAKSLSKHYRIGAPWLYLSSSGNAEINEEIKKQRLSPKDVIELDKPNLSYEEKIEKDVSGCGCVEEGDDRLFAACLKNRRNFHVDPYGKMAFCSFIKDPNLRYDLRKGTVEEGWERFIPSLADKVRGTKEYFEGCGSCKSRKNCRRCPVYSYLEHGDYSKRVEYLCDVAHENDKYKENWKKNHRAYYQIGGITIQIDSAIEIKEGTFHKKLDAFKTAGSGEDTISLQHYFSLPEIKKEELGQKCYYKAPWAIYNKGDSWVYLGISPTTGDENLHRVAVFNRDHSRGIIYSKDEEQFNKGNLTSLTFFPTDQILIARVLADRKGCLMHSCGIVMEGKGLLFVGHSEAGKSTTSMMLKSAGGEILCDDRIIIRKQPAGFRIYGTWSHGDVPDISPNDAPLHAIFFLEQAKENRLIKIKDKKEILKRLLACLIKPFVTNDWWDKELALIENIVKDVPCYRMLFDKSGGIVEKIRAV